MTSFLRAVFAVAITVCLTSPQHALAQNTPVTFAGLAFAGDAATLDERFPYSRKYESELARSGANAYQLIKQGIDRSPPQHLDLGAGQIDELKGRDQALVTSLVISSETVSLERFGGLTKLFILIRGQAMFFDVKSMTVVRAYPLSFAYIDVLDRRPSAAQVLQRVRGVYEGASGKPGIFARYANVLATATVPSQVPRYVKVTEVGLANDVQAALPAHLKSAPGVADTWAADLFSEALSTRLGIPLVPYVKGYAVGNVIPMRVSDGTVYTLNLPSPDYEISVDLTGFKKVEFGKSAAGASFVYGTYAHVKIQEPLSGTVYLDSTFKNGEVKAVPATQTYVDDFPAYYDSVNGLFKKLAGAIGGERSDWLASAAGANDIATQISKTRTLLNSCK